MVTSEEDPVLAGSDRGDSAAGTSGVVAAGGLVYSTEAEDAVDPPETQDSPREALPTPKARRDEPEKSRADLRRGPC